jgi:rhodanese-related sulfurtransferase
MKTGRQLVEEARARVKQVSVEDVMEMQRRGEKVTFLDVRDLHEVNLGKIPGTVHVSRGNLETKIEALIPRDANVIIYCASGNRSAFAAETMEQMGYEHVASMDGGFRAWAEAGGDIE